MYRGFHGMAIRAETDKSKPMPYDLMNPHYTDERFSQSSHTVFLAPGYETEYRYGSEMVKSQDVHYEYSDRIVGWYPSEQIDAAWKVAVEKGSAEKSIQRIEDYLAALHKDPGLKIMHVVTGVNRGNGYPYRVYGFITSKKEVEVVEESIATVEVLESLDISK